MDDIRELLRPSASHRWSNCPGSVSLQMQGGRRRVVEEDPDYLISGLAAHKLAELRLRVILAGKKDREFKKVQVFETTSPNAFYDVDSDMYNKVSEYIDAALSMSEGAIVRKVEQTLQTITTTGTADFVAELEDELQIHDLKYGYRDVQAEYNPQLMMYADAYIKEMELIDEVHPEHDVRLVIHMPNINQVFEWRTTVKTIKKEVLALSVVANAIEQSDLLGEAGELNPGEKQCLYCPVKPFCPAIEKAVADALETDILTEDSVENAKGKVPEMHEDRLARLLPLLPMIEKWCDSVHARAKAELEAGHEIPGYKLVHGRKGRRKWKVDSETLLKKFLSLRLSRTALYEKKLVTPPTVEKLVGKDKFERHFLDFISQPEGSLTVVPENDKREKITVTETDMFDD